MQEFYGFMDYIVEALHSLSYLSEYSHFVKVPFIDDQINPLSETLGMEAGLLKCALSFFLIYPMAAVLFIIPTNKGKHLYSMIGGLILMQWIFGPEWIHSFITSAITYLLCLMAPKKHVHIIVFTFVLAYVTCCHIYHMYTKYLILSFDVTGTQMVMTMKLSTFAFNLYDGTTDKKNVFDTKHTDNKQAKVYKDRRLYALQELPNLLEYFGYVFCFPCIVAGPAFEFADYKRCIEGSQFVVNGKQKSDTFNQLKHTLLCFVQGVAALGLYMYVAKTFPVKKLFDATFIATNPYWFRFLYMYLSCYAQRCSFYFCWKMAEGAGALAGFGFEGFDTKTNEPLGWAAVQNVDILHCETDSNLATLTRSWNKRTQGWLEKYVYLRTNRSLVATYFVSAFWHGLYPGFYIFFGTLPLLTIVERLVKSRVNPLLVPSFDGRNYKTYPFTSFVGFTYFVVSMGIFRLSLAYYSQAVLMYSFERSIIALQSLYYAPHLLLVVIYVLLHLLPKSEKTKTNINKKGQ